MRQIKLFLENNSVL